MLSEDLTIEERKERIRLLEVQHEDAAASRLAANIEEFDSEIRRYRMLTASSKAMLEDAHTAIAAERRLALFLEHVNESSELAWCWMPEKVLALTACRRAANLQACPITDDLNLAPTATLTDAISNMDKSAGVEAWAIGDRRKTPEHTRGGDARTPPQAHAICTIDAGEFSGSLALPASGSELFRTEGPTSMNVFASENFISGRSYHFSPLENHAQIYEQTQGQETTVATAEIHRLRTIVLKRRAAVFAAALEMMQAKNNLSEASGRLAEDTAAQNAAVEVEEQLAAATAADADRADARVAEMQARLAAVGATAANLRSEFAAASERAAAIRRRVRRVMAIVNHEVAPPASSGIRHLPVAWANELRQAFAADAEAGNVITLAWLAADARRWVPDRSRTASQRTMDNGL